jgi:hypothetical protein
MAAISLATSGRQISSKAKFGGNGMLITYTEATTTS